MPLFARVAGVLSALFILLVSASVPTEAASKNCSLSWPQYFEQARPRALQRGWSGLVADPVAKPGGGNYAVVRMVLPESPASIAKVQVGDQIVAIDGKEPPGSLELFSGYWRGTKVGQTVTLALRRGATVVPTTLKLVSPKLEIAIEAYVIDFLGAECGKERQFAAVQEINAARAQKGPRP